MHFSWYSQGLIRTVKEIVSCKLKYTQLPVGCLFSPRVLIRLWINLSAITCLLQVTHFLQPYITSYTSFAVVCHVSVLMFLLQVLPKLSSHMHHVSLGMCFTLKFSCRFLTFCYLAAFNFWLLLCPAALSHDWQMGSVPLLTSLADTRNIATCLFFGCCFLIAYRGIADFEVRLKHAVYILTLYT